MAEKIKAVVVKRFRNKFSKVIHKAGDVIEVTPNRLAEINSAGHGVLAEEIDVEATLADAETSVDPSADAEKKDKPPKNKKK